MNRSFHSFHTASKAILLDILDSPVSLSVKTMGISRGLNPFRHARSFSSTCSGSACGDSANRPPVLNPIGPRSVTRGQSLVFTVRASDPDGDAVEFTAPLEADLPGDAKFTDSGNGSAEFRWSQAAPSGTYSVPFPASDGVLADTEVVKITVRESEQSLSVVVVKKRIGGDNPIVRLYIPGPTSIVPGSVTLDGANRFITRLAWWSTATNLPPGAVTTLTVSQPDASKPGASQPGCSSRAS